MSTILKAIESKVLRNLPAGKVYRPVEELLTLKCRHNLNAWVTTKSQKMWVKVFF